MAEQSAKPSEASDEVIDLKRLASQVRDLLSECDEFRERLAGLSRT